jgi:hypothetical protein
MFEAGKLDHMYPPDDLPAVSVFCQREVPLASGARIAPRPLA